MRQDQAQMLANVLLMGVVQLQPVLRENVDLRFDTSVPFRWRARRAGPKIRVDTRLTPGENGASASLQRLAQASADLLLGRTTAKQMTEPLTDGQPTAHYRPVSRSSRDRQSFQSKTDWIALEGHIRLEIAAYGRGEQDAKFTLEAIDQILANETGRGGEL